jgi:helix-turn-helix protein/PEGA domain-containing protein
MASGTTFGEWLKQAREARGLTIEAITQQTRIPRRHIEALEHDVLDLLPDFYERAEVRAFARAVGVDERLAIERFNALASPPPPQPAPHPAPQLAGRIPLGSALVAVVAVALMAWLAGRPSAGEDPSPRLTADAGARTDPNPGPLAVTPAAELAASVTGVPAAPPAEMNTQLVIRTRPEGARVTVDGIGWGTSPLSIRHLPPGDKRIRVSKPGYGSSERVVAVGAGNREAVDIALVPLAGER